MDRSISQVTRAEIQPPASAESPAASWFVVQHRQQARAEFLCNLLRLAAILAFCVVELAFASGIRFGNGDLRRPTDPDVQQTGTAVAVAWMALALAVHVALALHVRPAWITAASITLDLVLLVLLLCLAGGPRSPLVTGFFLIVALAALRFSNRVVLLATLGALAGYAIVVLFASRAPADRPIGVPPSHQALVLLALALLGMALYHGVTQARILAYDFARRRLDVPHPRPGDAP